MNVIEKDEKDRKKRHVRAVKAAVDNDCPDGLLSIYKCKDNSNFNVQPKILICITVYNEEKTLLEKTLTGLLSNIAEF